MYLMANRSENLIDIQWLRQALHQEPEKLRRTVQSFIDETDANLAEEPYDAILLGYGLCSNGVANLSARSIPVIVPRAHDCITLLLGSKETYQTLFDEKHGGIYWYSTGWCEHSLMPGKARYDYILKQYAEKYGENNAQYLMEMEQNWMKEYNQAIYIHWPGINDRDYAQQTLDGAAFLNWSYSEVDGNPSIIERLFNGDWDNKDFLTVPPGRTIRPTYDQRIIDI